MDSLDKKYYKISEVADFLNIPPSTLRFWEKHFTLIKPKRNAKGTRYYTPQDIETIKMIYFLVKEKGLKLEAAEEQVKRNHSGISKRFVAIERLRSIRDTLQSLVNALDSKS